MKRKKLTFIILPLILATQFLSFTDHASKLALEKVQTQFEHGLSNLEAKILNYQEVATLLENDSVSIKNLQKAHLTTRLTYKKVEHFIEYFDPLAVKKSINGAPLLSVEPNVPEVNIIEPVGLQVLDELVFSENPFAEKEEISRLLKKLTTGFVRVKEYQLRIDLTHQQIFEATRKQLIRIFTLGLTGFDTPDSTNAIPEAKASFKALFNNLQAYFSILETHEKGLAIVLDARFREAINYLEKNNDFENFDRLVFLRNHIDPLFDIIYNTQLALNIETKKEVIKTPLATNEAARSFWSEEYFNKSFYANINLKHELTDKRIELGRTLFFDPILSKNLNTSCASCHQPEKAFTDGLPKSLASNGKETIKRNAPTLLNSVYADKFFYDLRETNLERQINHVILHEKEFGTNFMEIIEKLKQSEEYRDLFANAYADFPKYRFTKWSISDALANYVASLTSFNSPFDQYVRGENMAIGEEVKRGFNLFMGKASCGTCHFAPTFTGLVPPNFMENETEVLGIPDSPEKKTQKIDEDLGRYASTLPRDRAEFYKHSFKTTTIRNIAETAPYMHNGVFETLEEVVDFYNDGGGIGLDFDLKHQTLPDTKLNLTEEEKQALIAFMKSLSDNPFENDKPDFLPEFEGKPEWNERKTGGSY